MSKIKSKKKKTPFIYKVFAILLILVSLFLIGSIIYLNILNFLLLVLVSGIIFIISGFSVLLMLKSRKKKTGFGISLLLIIIFSLVSFYINKTTGLLSNLNLTYKTYNYSVVVLKSSPYKKIKDISGLKIGYNDNGSVEMDKALNKVLEKIELESTGYEDNYELADALLTGESDAILIENSYLDILNESISNSEGSFKDKIKSIYDFVIVANTSDISKDINVTKEPFNIYVSGIDTYGEISSVSRSDVNMVVSVNPDTHQILLTSIPRDYYVKLHGKSGYPDKLTHAGLYGTDMSIQTIEDLLDIEINYYVKVNFSSVINIVDAIGGVEVYSDYTFTSLDGYQYKKGYNEVNGEEALSFVRERKAFATGDRQRIKNQQALLRAIFDKCLSKTIITKYTNLIDSMHGSFVTNMKMSRLTSLVRMQLSNNYAWNLVTNNLSGKDSSNYTYSAPSHKAYVMVPDEESVLYATELINKVIDGEVLNEDTMAEVGNQVNKVTKKDNTSNNKLNSNEVKNNSSEVHDKLVVRLAKSSVSFAEGDEYIYHGYSISYDGIDISGSKDIEETFSINDKTYDNYQDLVFYVSKLSHGEYTIKYTIKYKGEVVNLDQKVIVEKLKLNDEIKDDDNTKKDYDLDNKKIEEEDD